MPSHIQHGIDQIGVGQSLLYRLNAILCQKVGRGRRLYLQVLISRNQPPELPPMAAGIFGYLGYDTVRLA